MLSPETTVAIVALVVALPPAVAVIWRWYRSRPQRTRTTSYRDEELSLVPRPEQHPLPLGFLHWAVDDAREPPAVRQPGHVRETRNTAPRFELEQEVYRLLYT